MARVSFENNKVTVKSDDYKNTQLDSLKKSTPPPPKTKGK